MATARTWSISAEWIVPGDTAPVRHGVMRGRGKRIDAIGPPQTVGYAENHRELGCVAVLPGLVNAHTHLELTHLQGQLPRRRPLTQWLFALRNRRLRGEKLRQAVAQGAAAAVAAGTTTLGDVCHNNQAWRALKSSPLRKLCFAETLGIGPLTDSAIPKLKRELAGIRKAEKLRFGVAPHAPYSTADSVYRQAIEIARKRDMIVATHLAETEAERQFTLRGSGKFFEFLAHMGLIDSTVAIHACTPLAFAQRVGLFDGPCILAHANFIDNEEFEILRTSGASVAYCPRSNDFFGRSGHRYAEMLAAGINVCLGTDSLASNASLEMLEEMRRVRLDGKVDSFTILRMATLNGARALAWDDEVGSLTPGKMADWISVEVPPDATNPVEAILTSRGRVLETVIGAKTCYVLEEG